MELAALVIVNVLTASAMYFLFSLRFTSAVQKAARGSVLKELRENVEATVEFINTALDLMDEKNKTFYRMLRRSEELVQELEALRTEPEKKRSSSRKTSRVDPTQKKGSGGRGVSPTEPEKKAGHSAKEEPEDSFTGDGSVAHLEKLLSRNYEDEFRFSETTLQDRGAGISSRNGTGQALSDRYRGSSGTGGAVPPKKQDSGSLIRALEMTGRTVLGMLGIRMPSPPDEVSPSEVSPVSTTVSGSREKKGDSGISFQTMLESPGVRRQSDPEPSGKREVESGNGGEKREVESGAEIEPGSASHSSNPDGDHLELSGQKPGQPGSRRAEQRERINGARGKTSEEQIRDYLEREEGTLPENFFTEKPGPEMDETPTGHSPEPERSSSRTTLSEMEETLDAFFREQELDRNGKIELIRRLAREGYDPMELAMASGLGRAEVDFLLNLPEDRGRRRRKRMVIE